jgi:hypothetical protein
VTFKTQVRGNLTAMVWKDKRNAHILTNMHSPPAEGNLCDKYRNALKPATVEDYNRHTGYVDKSDIMATSYSTSRRPWKWTKKIFFHLWILLFSIVIILASCGSKLSH